MEKDREVDRLLEIHDDLRARTKVWLRNEDWGEEESRRLREEAALINHRRYLRRTHSFLPGPGRVVGGRGERGRRGGDQDGIDVHGRHL